MPQPQAGTLVPLSTVSKKFSYTQDHLAYLCRRGLVAAERKGRKWLSSETAVINYQKSLEIAGRPVAVSEQTKVLSKPKTESSSVNIGIAGLQKSQQKINLGFYKLADNIAIKLESVFLRYRSVLLHHTQARAVVPAIVYAGVGVGLPPTNLPIGELPKSLANKPFYSESLITAPLGIVLLFVLFSLNPGIATSTVKTADTFLSDTGTKVSFQLQRKMSILSKNTEVTVHKQGRQEESKVAGVSKNAFYQVENARAYGQNSSNLSSFLESIQAIASKTLGVVRRSFEILELTAANFFAIMVTD